MRILIFLILISISASTFALDSDIAQEISLQSNIDTLKQNGRKSLKTLSDNDSRRYVLSLLESYEDTIRYALYTHTPYAYRSYYHNVEERTGYYEKYLRPLYDKTLSQIADRDVSLSIDAKTRNEIEATTLSYQQEFVSSIRKTMQKYVLSDILQKGNMNFSYEGSGGYVRVKIDEYTATTSIDRDEQSVDFRLSVDMDMEVPGKTICDYDEEYEYICETGSGTRLAGTASMHMSTWTVGDRYYIQIHNFTLDPRLSGTDAADLQAALSEIRKYTDNKVYTYTVPNYGISEKEVLVKMLEVLDVLDATSIFTPRVRFGDEYSMNFNPIFVKKINAITGETQTPEGNLIPEIRYKDGIYRFYLPTEDFNIYDIRLGRGTDGIIALDFDISEYGSSNTFSGKITKKSWDILLDIPDMFHMTSTWDGHKTLTEITGAGLSSLYRSYLSGYRGGYVSEEDIPSIEKIEFSGILDDTEASLSLFVDEEKVGYIESKKSGSYMSYLSWIRFGLNKFEISGNAIEEFGTFLITPPVGAIELDMDDGAVLSDSLSSASNTLLSR